MAMSHVAHDCRLGDGVIVINYAGITGHCTIGDRVTIGGYVGIHTVHPNRAYAYVGGCSKVTADVPPFVHRGRKPGRRPRDQRRRASSRAG